MTTGPRPPGRRHLSVGPGWLAVLAAGAMTVVAAGCTGAAPSSSSPEATAGRPSAPIVATSAPVAATPAPTPASPSIVTSTAPEPSPTRRPSATPDGSAVIPSAEAPAGFPGALLVGGTGAEVPGTVGSYTWDAVASDTPWLPAGVLATSEAGAGDPLGVRIDGAAVAGWTAAAAPAADRIGLAATALGEGGGPEISFRAPAAGDYVVLVHVAFVGGGDAAWYWHVVVR
jgi:hypothetical protein